VQSNSNRVARYILLFFVLFSAKCLAAEEKKDPPPKLLCVGLGIFDIIHDPHHVLLQFEYRTYFHRCHYARPLIGIFGTEKGSIYVYGGIAFDIFLGKKVVLSPSFAPGLYYKGKGKDLGFPLEFRSALELDYIFPNKSRFGAQFYHISNASLGHKNPGVEALVFLYSIPLN
jgi:lipid A 3-O-deacylase